MPLLSSVDSGVWGGGRWAAALGVVLAISRAFIVDDAAAAFHPELAMLEVRVTHSLLTLLPLLVFLSSLL